MADMTREKAIKELIVIKEDYEETDDYGQLTQYCQEPCYAIDKAISDMKRVDALEAENARLKEGIENVKAEIERKCIGTQWNEAVIYGMQKAMYVINKYLGEVGDKE